jgi:hypothetical protein
MMVAKRLAVGVCCLAGSFLILAGCGGSDKKVYFGNLMDGASVESPFKVEMKAENLIVEPATLGVNEGHGHFHILVDGSLASPSAPIAKDAQHIHYGNGQMETTLDLPVGQHTLILEFAKGDHVPYDPPIYQQITVNVTKRNVPDTTAQAKPADSTAAKADTAAKAAASTGTDTAQAKAHPKTAPKAAKKKTK